MCINNLRYFIIETIKHLQVRHSSLLIECQLGLAYQSLNNRVEKP